MTVLKIISMVVFHLGVLAFVSLCWYKVGKFRTQSRTLRHTNKFFKQNREDFKKIRNMEGTDIDTLIQKAELMAKTEGRIEVMKSIIELYD